MKKLIGLTAATLLLGVPTLAACGGSDDSSSTDDTTATTSAETSSDATEPTESTESSDSADASSPYCKELQQAKASFTGLNTGQIDEKTYLQLVAELKTVTSLAPDDVKDDWAAFGGALTKLHDLLASANISFDDLQTLSAGQLPPGVDAQKVQEISPKVQQISQDLVKTASSQNIQKSATSECGITLN